MKAYFLPFICFGSCFCEWVLLPSISPKQKNGSSNGKESPKGLTRRDFDFCPDFHNLTAMTFGSVFEEKVQRRDGWEISLGDVEDLIKESQKLPKKSGERANFVKEMGDMLMSEAEKRLESLFSTREARTKHFHFVTMESALMTISLLLFGVYLSKLILKLLLSHYNRYNGGVAMMTGIRAPITLAHVRRARSLQREEIQLMHLIDKYNVRFNQNTNNNY